MQKKNIGLSIYDVLKLDFSCVDVFDYYRGYKVDTAEVCFVMYYSGKFVTHLSDALAVLLKVPYGVFNPSVGCRAC